MRGPEAILAAVEGRPPGKLWFANGFQRVKQLRKVLSLHECHLSISAVFSKAHAR